MSNELERHPRLDLSPANRSMDQYRILLVEDDGIIARHLGRSLTRMGYQVIGCVVTGEDAIQISEQARPDLVLIDISLRGHLDGVETAHQIYSQWDIPVVYLTAYDDPDILQRAKYSSPFGYLVKPFEDRTLHATVEMAINKHDLESRLRASEERYRQIVETSLEGIWVFDREGRTLYTNKRMTEILGITQDESMTTSLLQNVVADQRSEFIKDLSSSFLERAPREYRLIREDGKQIWTLASFNQMGGTHDKGEQILGMFTDITEKKQAEAAQRESEARFRASFEGAGIGIALLGNQGRILEANPALADMLGFTSEELREKQLIEITYPDDAKENGSFIRGLETGELNRLEVEKRYVCKSGKIIWGRLTMSPVRDDDGQVKFIISMLEDITASKERQREIEMLGKISAGLSHAATLGEMIPGFLDQILEVTSTLGAAVILSSKEEDELIVELGRGVWSDRGGRKVPRNQSGSGYVLDTGLPYVNNRVQQTPENMILDLIGKVKCVIGMPLITHGRVIGVLWVGKDDPFDYEVIRLLDAIAGMAGSAIQRAYLF